MILYHGTSLRRLEKIKKEGLKPRQEKKSNWETGIGKSRKDLVYLTNCYACYYASASCKNNDKPVVLKLDIDANKLQLFPDEEFLFRSSSICKETNKEKAIELYEEIDPTDLEQFINKKTGECINWEDSLEFMGTITAKFIPKECIIGYVIGEGIDFTMNCDPSVSLMNYKFCGDMYKEYLKNLTFKKL